MSDAFIGQISTFGQNWIPEGWLPCFGGEYSIQQYQALFSILGYTFGGTQNQTFKVPDLRTFATLSQGQGPGLTSHTFGTSGGAASVALTSNQIPPHTHQWEAGSGAAGNTPAPNATSYVFRTDTGGSLWTDQTTPNTTLINSTIGSTGGGLPHENRQPYLAVNFAICATDGIYPVNPN